MECVFGFFGWKVTIWKTKSAVNGWRVFTADMHSGTFFVFKWPVEKVKQVSRELHGFWNLQRLSKWGSSKAIVHEVLNILVCWAPQEVVTCAVKSWLGLPAFMKLYLYEIGNWSGATFHGGMASGWEQQLHSPCAPLYRRGGGLEPCIITWLWRIGLSRVSQRLRLPNVLKTVLCLSHLLLFTGKISDRGSTPHLLKISKKKRRSYWYLSEAQTL